MAKNKEPKRRNFSKINLLLVLIWMAVIFGFSSLEGDGVKYTPSVWFYVERKGAHIAEFFILNVLLINLFLKRYSTVGGGILVASLLALLYAVLDETHQLFVFGREGKVTDVGFDLIGITLAVVVFGVFNRIKNMEK